MSRKKGIPIIFLLVVMVLALKWWSAQVRKNHEQRCRSNMEVLYSAAISSCLEQKKGPDEVLNFDEVAMYVRPMDRVCPEGHIPYASFSVLQGPACPHGHQFLPGEKRPLTASANNAKMRGLYMAYGFTNLIVHETASRPE